ncbi:MAG: BlaI/MecI/CopY family transcriptional regulator [Oscillospiraceae bacterium]
MNQISDSELEIMRIIWDRGGEAMYADIVGDLEEKELFWKKNTVLTFLARLVEKGLLQTSKVGRRNDYRALVSADDYLAQQTKTFVGKVYEGNVKGLVSTLVEQNLISSGDLDELRKYWDDKE